MEEDKYVDLLESLKKNDTIKEYMNRTLIEKVGENRNVKKVLEVMTEKYSRTKGEKMLEVMKNISGFKTDEKVEVLMDRFEDMVMEVDRIELATNLKYALSLQFVDRLEKSGKINTGEKLRLKDVIEDENGEPRAGDVTEKLKKELRKIKVIDNREEVFPRSKEYNTHYVRNNENRSRYNNWRNLLESQGYYRSKSKPGYWKNDRATSKNRYVRDDSRFGRSQSNKGQMQSRGKSQERK